MEGTAVYVRAQRWCGRLSRLILYHEKQALLLVTQLSGCCSLLHVPLTPEQAVGKAYWKRATKDITSKNIPNKVVFDLGDHLLL